MPEWLKGADCKSATLCYVGSNPTRPNYVDIKYLSKDYFVEWSFKFIYTKICNLVPQNYRGKNWYTKIFRFFLGFMNVTC